MAEPDYDPTKRIRELESSLYAGGTSNEQARSKLHVAHTHAPEDWQQVSTETITMKKKTRFNNWYKKFFLGALGFFALALVFAGFTFLRGGNAVSSKYINLTILGKTFADGGEQIPFQIEIENGNNADLELVTLFIEYPEGGVDGSSLVRTKRDLGTIRAGESLVEDVTLQLFGQEGSEQEITARLEYRVQGSNAIFEKTTNHNLVLRSSPIRLAVAALDTSVPNQEITYTVTITSNGTETLQNIMVEASYPTGFRFTQSEPDVSLGENIWIIGDLPPGAEREISITGTLSGEEDELKTFRAAVGTQEPGNERKIGAVYQTLAHVTELKQAFLDARILVNGVSDPRVVVEPGKDIDITVEWQNTMSTPVTQAEIKLAFSGNAYDKRGVGMIFNGFFDSNINTVVWSPVQNQALVTVDPGESGNFTFRFTPKSLASPEGLVYAPVVQLATSVRAIQEGGEILQASNVDQKTVAITSDLRLTQKTLYYSGPFTNTGPMPPRAEESTTYTVVWQLSNSSNKVRGTVLKTSLPPYVAWKGVVSPANASSALSYNSVTREITWDIGDIERGVGFSGTSPQEIAFQVAITPSSSQAFTAVDITKPVVITATDSVTESVITVTKNPHTTRLVGDSSTIGGNGIIAP